MNEDRRRFFKQLGSIAGGSALWMSMSSLYGGNSMMEDPLELPDLPYGYDALAPVLNEQTLRLHHDKHHAGYVKGLKSALIKLETLRASGDYSAVKHVERDLAFHGSGHVLHTLYWNSLVPDGGGKPGGSLGRMIDKQFGGYKSFKAQLAAATRSVEASGWGVVAVQPMLNKLLILQCEKHQNLTVWGAIPILVIDVWEHAYYLDYQNRRGEYINRLFEIMDWRSAEKRFETVMKTI